MEYRGFDDILSSPFIFTERPSAVPGDMRLSWRISICLLILNSSRSSKASLQKLLFLGHAIRTPQNRMNAAKALSGLSQYFAFIFRVEPTISRALDFARGSGLIRQIDGKSFQLTSDGIAAVKQISVDPELFRNEKAFLEEVRNLATEKRIMQILSMEG